MAEELISQIWHLFCRTITGHPDGEVRVNFDRCERPGYSILSC